MKQFLKYLIFCWLIISCREDDFVPEGSDRNYFPLQTGLYQVYRIDETVYSEVNPVETRKYLLKIEVVDSFATAEGDYTYVLSRSKRPDANAAWTNLDTWSVRSSERELVINEGNVPFVKLVFPLRKGSEWNGNTFNSFQEDEYTVSEFDRPTTVAGMAFDKTLTVTEEDNGDFIFFLDERKSVYARDIGLISRESTQLNFCTDDNCRGQQKIKSGIIYKQEISEYGTR